MKLRPFKSKRRPNRGDFWSLEVDLDIDPTSLNPSGKAKHDVLLANGDTMAWEFTVNGQCGPMLRYGSKDIWGPHRVKLKPKENSAVRGQIGLPASCNKEQLPSSERIEVKVDAKPVNPGILAQEDSLYCDFELNE